MSIKDEEPSKIDYMVVLIIAVIVGLCALTAAGALPQEKNCETSAYWDGTHYTCHP